MGLVVLLEESSRYPHTSPVLIRKREGTKKLFQELLLSWGKKAPLSRPLQDTVHKGAPAPFSSFVSRGGGERARGGVSPKKELAQSQPLPQTSGLRPRGGQREKKQPDDWACRLPPRDPGCGGAWEIPGGYQISVVSGNRSPGYWRERKKTNAGPYPGGQKNRN